MRNEWRRFLDLSFRERNNDKSPHYLEQSCVEKPSLQQQDASQRTQSDDITNSPNLWRKGIDLFDEDGMNQQRTILGLVTKRDVTAQGRGLGLRCPGTNILEILTLIFVLESGRNLLIARKIQL